MNVTRPHVLGEGCDVSCVAASEGVTAAGAHSCVVQLSGGYLGICYVVFWWWHRLDCRALCRHLSCTSIAYSEKGVTEWLPLVFAAHEGPARSGWRSGVLSSRPHSRLCVQVPCWYLPTATRFKSSSECCRDLVFFLPSARSR